MESTERAKRRPTKRAGLKDPARGLAVSAAAIASDNHCEQVVVLDLRGISPAADYFVIATGTSDRQMCSTADEIAKYARRIGQPVYKVSGLETGQWVLLDFVDVVVHLFDRNCRNYYDLELIWGEAPKVRRRKSTQVKSRKKDPPQ